jgi:hypothetical protein
MSKKKLKSKLKIKKCQRPKNKKNIKLKKVL